MKKYDPSEIQVLETGEAIRLRPSMYVGELNSSVLTRFVGEALCLAAGGVTPERSVNARVKVFRRNSGDSISVEDDGPGLCVDVMGSSGRRFSDTLMTEIFACRHHKIDHESSSFCKMGLAIVNHLSDTFRLEVKHADGNVYVHVYDKGKLEAFVNFSPETLEQLTKLREGSLGIIGPTTQTGNRIAFTPDRELLGDLMFNIDAIRELAQNAMSEMPGLSVTVEEIRHERE